MPEIESPEEWEGQTVIDSAGEKIGKLTAVFLDTTTGTPVLGAVRLGILGRSEVAVPLTDASFARGHVRVDFPRKVIHSAPKLASGSVSGEDAMVIARHYGVAAPERGDATPDEPVYESASSIRDRAEAAKAVAAQAARLDAEADQQASIAQKAEDRAADAAGEARRADEERASLQAQAQALRETQD